MNCIKTMYNGIKRFVKCGEDEATDSIEQRRGIRHGCSLNPYLFNIFINDIMDFINKGNLCAITTWERTIPGSLCADYLATSSFTDLCIREHNLINIISYIISSYIHTSLLHSMDP
jgi:hypothetical protein